MCRLPADGAGRPAVTVLEHGLRLVVGQVADGREMVGIATAPFGDAPSAISHSVAGNRRAAIAGWTGRVGLDIETIARVELNATSQDRWLAPSERALVEAATRQTVELACHWVLKEAYGKALGVGLALPLDQLAFGSRGGAVVLEGTAAPEGSAGWRFSLYCDADLLIGVAHQQGAQAATPLTPAGRKPPMPLLDR